MPSEKLLTNPAYPKMLKHFNYVAKSLDLHAPLLSLLLKNSQVESLATNVVSFTADDDQIQQVRNQPVILCKNVYMPYAGYVDENQHPTPYIDGENSEYEPAIKEIFKYFLSAYDSLAYDRLDSIYSSDPVEATTIAGIKSFISNERAFGSKKSILVCSYKTEDYLISSNKYERTREDNVAYKYSTYSLQGIPIVPDYRCANNYLYLLDLSTIKLFQRAETNYTGHIFENGTLYTGVPLEDKEILIRLEGLKQVPGNIQIQLKSFFRVNGQLASVRRLKIKY